MTLLSLPESQMPASKGQVPSLDGLRAVSITIVLLGHALLPSQFLGVSALGVLIFFFISGFLITRLLFAEFGADGSVNLRQFYARRFLRLYPVIVFFMTLVVLVALARGIRIDKLEIAAVFGYFANYLIAWRDVHMHLANSEALNTLPIGVLWSLSVEEHFYFLMPSLFLLARGEPKRVAAIAIGICLLSLAVRIVYASVWGVEIGSAGIYKRSESRFDSIAFGVLLAACCQIPRYRSMLQRIANPTAFWLGCGVLVLSFAMRNRFYQDTIRFTIQSASLIPIFATILFSERVRVVNVVLNFASVAWIGVLSYSLYVWHGGVHFLVGAQIDSLPGDLHAVVFIGVTFLFATLSYYFIERPFLKLRRFFLPGRVMQSRIEPKTIQ